MGAYETRYIDLGSLSYSISRVSHRRLQSICYGKSKTNEQTKHADHDQEKMDNQEGHQAHEDHSTNKASDVTPKVSYANGEITIELKDKNKHVPELEVSHENKCI